MFSQSKWWLVFFMMFKLLSRTSYLVLYIDVFIITLYFDLLIWWFYARHVICVNILYTSYINISPNIFIIITFYININVGILKRIRQKCLYVFPLVYISCFLYIYNSEIIVVIRDGDHTYMRVRVFDETQQDNLTIPNRHACTYYIPSGLQA